jgi:large subunit ribosomal protein L10
MDKEQKAAAVAELTDSLKEAEAIFAVDYRGISVTQAADLRRRLAEADAVFRVVKNRLAKRAVADAGTEGVDELLVGPTALTLIKGDAVVAAKAIATFTREHQVLEYKGGLMDGEVLDADSFQAIARLPGLDVLHGQLVGLTASPLTGLITGLNSMISGLAIALGQIAERGLVTGEAPAAEEEEASAEEPSGEPEPETEVESSPEAEPEAEAGEGETPAEPEAEAEEAAPPAEHAEEEAQPEEPSEAPADEAPGEPQGEAEAEQDEATSTEDPDAPGREAEEAAGSDSEQEEPSGDESDD